MSTEVGDGVSAITENDISRELRLRWRKLMLGHFSN